MTFEQFAEQWLPAVERELESLLPGADRQPGNLHAAMRHAMFPGGKRLRPLLALLTLSAAGGVP